MIKRSRQKETILKVLRSTSSHPRADWVYDQVRKEIPNVSLATIYRNLRLIKEAGYIQQVDSPSEQGRFDGNTSVHYHLRCEKCGRIIDLNEPVQRSIEERVAKGTGFKVTGHRLDVLGLCPECQL
jgi:Fur family transcriptional regulator, peroxide stress response regulator